MTHLMAIAPRLRTTFNWDALCEQLNTHGWVQVPNILARADADALYRTLRELQPWHTSIGAGTQSWSVPAGADTSLAMDHAHTLAGASQGFAYAFEHIPSVETGLAPALAGVEALVRSEAFLDIGRRLLGDDICYADAQACRYGPGHFLAVHNDDVAGKHRRAAYVLNLTPEWRADWGGLLLFHDEKGRVTNGLVPGYNVLNIFKVPVAHSVSAVAPFAPARRYSITGWMRTQPD